MPTSPYLLKAKDEDMARWTLDAKTADLSFAEYVRRALDEAGRRVLPERGSSAADVDGAARSGNAGSGRHESVGERQGRQPRSGKTSNAKSAKKCDRAHFHRSGSWCSSCGEVPS